MNHTVKVIAQYDGEVELTPDVTFTCNESATASCHRYPDCTCEEWWIEPDGSADTEGHPTTEHNECWAQAWFDNGSHEFTGPTADDTGDYGIPRGFTREGDVTLDFNGYRVEWKFQAEMSVA